MSYLEKFAGKKNKNKKGQNNVFENYLIKS